MTKRANSCLYFELNSILAKSRRSQVTLFVIIALVIIAVIAGYFIVKNKTSFLTSIVPVEIQPVHDYVSDCVKKSGISAINKVSFYGGYNSFETGVLNINSTVPYWVFDNQSYIPSKSIVDSELSKAFSEVFLSCIDDFKDLPEFKITPSDFSVKSDFSEDEVSFDLKYPLAITKKGSSFSLENFNEKISSNFGAMYASAKEIAETSIDRSTRLCFTCMSQSLSSREIYGQIFDYSNSSYILVITPEDTKIKNATMQFNIALGY